MRVAAPIVEAVQAMVDFVYPPRCPLCGEHVGTQTGLCMACWQELAIPGDPSCIACGRPFADDVVPGSTCAPCLADPPLHDGIAAATLYNDTSRRLVLQFKYASRLALAGFMARLVAPQLAGRCREGTGEALLVPVPLHRWRLWHRGYNQAAVLAAALARETGARVCLDALERRKRTKPLGSMGRKARQRALSGAIRVSERRRPVLAGASVILVDDVLTSGATSRACVAALKRAGAARVVIACFARVLDEALDAANPAVPERYDQAGEGAWTRKRPGPKSRASS